LHYDNEPFGNAIYIESPANNTFHVLGNDIQVVTSYTGSTPDAVNFYIDGEKVAEDNEAPYEYIWETEGFNAGEHVIMVKEMLGGIKISEDEATITLQEVFWSEIDLSNLGVDANTRCTDIVYYSSTEAWICTSAPGQGKVLRTYDGGTTWVEVSTTPLGLEQMLVFNDAGQGLFLTQNHKVFYTEDGGETVAELEYGNEYYSQPTFQWKEIFGFGTNLDGEIVAVGKDTGIPYQFEVYRANAASHEPISDYEIPHPNEYGYSPSIYLRGAEAIVYGIQDEDQPNSNYYLTSNDGGVTWANHQFNGLTQTDYLKDASILNESEWWIVGENSTGQALVLISSNAGQSWENVVLDEVAGFNSVHFLDSNEGYATINKSTSVAEPKVYQTLDGGHTWQPVFGLNSTYGMGKVSFLGDQIGVVVGQGPIIYKFGVGK
ncbi:MAG: hypothetical protein GQ527_02115, partial [Bacteroidales bacterium]|nr:hypothetical protein [Bacteroidales bacterium]